MHSRIAIRFIVAIIALVGIGGYAFYESKDLREGPVVMIDFPLNGKVSSTAVTDITGRAKNIVKLKMNDREISMNEHGDFKEKFVLSDGSNVVKIAAEDRFGRKTEKLVEILYNEPSGTLTQR